MRKVTNLLLTDIALVGDHLDGHVARLASGGDCGRKVFVHQLPQGALQTYRRKSNISYCSWQDKNKTLPSAQISEAAQMYLGAQLSIKDKGAICDFTHTSTHAADIENNKR